jgi:allophanate hydrolase subunit 2
VGFIQIPDGTQPIVLHRAAVSGGGDATGGPIITADMNLLARSAPGIVTQFQAVTIDQALPIRREDADRLQDPSAAMAA